VRDVFLYAVPVAPADAKLEPIRQVRNHSDSVFGPSVIVPMLVHMVEASLQDDLAGAGFHYGRSCVESASRRKKLFALLQQLFPHLLPFRVSVLRAIVRGSTSARYELVKRQPSFHHYTTSPFCVVKVLLSSISYHGTSIVSIGFLRSAQKKSDRAFLWTRSRVWQASD